MKKKSLVYCTRCKYQYWDALFENNRLCQYNYNVTTDARYCKKFKPIEEIKWYKISLNRLLGHPDKILTKLEEDAIRYALKSIEIVEKLPNNKELVYMLYERNSLGIPLYEQGAEAIAKALSHCIGKEE